MVKLKATLPEIALGCDHRLDNHSVSADAEDVGERCDTCGFESGAEAFFRREAGGLTGRLRWVCRGCDVARPTAAERAWVRWTALWFSLGLIFGFGIWIQSGAPTALAAVLAVAVSGPLGVALHEAAHALAAVALGGRLLWVKLGSGRAVAQISAWVAPLIIGRYPAGGLTRFLWPTGMRRWSQLTVVSAGPAANLLAGGLALWAAAALSDRGSGAADLAASAALGFGVVQVAGGLANLWPQSPLAGGLLNDGLHIWKLVTWRATADDVAAFAAADAERFAIAGQDDRAAEAIRRAVAIAPDGFMLGLGMHYIAKAEGHAAAMRFYREEGDAIAAALAADEAAARAMRPWLQANIAWSALHAGELDLADRLSERAFEASPTWPAAQGTRGAVLLARGEPDRARELLLRAARGSLSTEDRAEFCRELSKLERAAGDAALAEAYDRLSEHPLSPDAQYR